LALSNRDAGAAADAIRESLDKGLRIYLSLLTEQGE
ncbi:GntR family transcriptional regulator, partial [Salmonella enterica]|nr:GntR family transcriptional regulator [Salmonella enterica]